MQQSSAVTIMTLIGGKLTTCRSFAERAVDDILARLGRPRRAHSLDRVIPGGERYPLTPADLARTHDRLARQFGLASDEVAAIWPLFGTLTERILSESGVAGGTRLDGTVLPMALARWIIRNEGPRRLADVIERRLMLVFAPRLTQRCLEQLADLWAVERGLDARARLAELHHARWRLTLFHRRRIEPLDTGPSP